MTPEQKMLAVMNDFIVERRVNAFVCKLMFPDIHPIALEDIKVAQNIINNLVEGASFEDAMNVISEMDTEPRELILSLCEVHGLRVEVENYGFIYLK